MDEPGSDQAGARQRVGLGSEPEPADEQSYGEWQDIEAEMAAGVLSGYTSSESDEEVEGNGTKDTEGGDDAVDEEDFQSLLEEVELD